jgi:hypothetical protein
MTNVSTDNKDKKREIAPSQVDTSPIEVTTTTTIGDKAITKFILNQIQEARLYRVINHSTI